MVMYADDVIIYLFEPEQSMMFLMDILEEYEYISGYRLNASKSEVMGMQS